jgi:transcriptional regulator with XRE-family HTH domain
MARGDAARKAKWSAYLRKNLESAGWKPAELSRRTGILNKTIYNWTLGDSVASAENCLILAAAFEVPASEVLEAAGYEILSKAMDGKELRLVGASLGEAPDPGIVRIMAQDDLPDDVKATMIQWWKQRQAEDEARRLADAEKMIEMQTERHSA